MWTITSKLVFLVLLVLLLLPLGCATNPDGSRPSVPPVLPVEAQALSNQTTYVFLRANQASMESTMSAKVALQSFNMLVQSLIKENPDQLEIVAQEHLSQLDTDVAVLLNNLSTIALSRIRILIDQGQTKLASDYLDAVVLGATQAMDIYLGSLAEADSLVQNVKLE